jgi:peptidoglycan/xylan/chitin deacetylase (PgdA/CDA1 family)
VKATLRKGVLVLADRLGVNRRLLRSRWREGRLLILCYHGFALRDEHRWNPELFISAARFRARLEYLRSLECNVLPLSDGLERLRSGDLPARAVCLTVDDGLYDFSAVGYPLLREFSFPVTVYVSTYYVEHQWPVFDVMLSYLLWLGAERGRRELHHELLGQQVCKLHPAVERTRTLARFRTAVNAAGLGGRARDELLAGLASQLGIDYADLSRSRTLSLMTPTELRSLDPRLVDLQLHTHRHRMPEDRTLLLREIAENRAVLASTGRASESLVHFCYPSGQYRREAAPWLQEAGVVSATTCDPGLASRHDDPLFLPRFIDTELTAEPEFAAWLSGLRSILNRRTFGL